MAMGRGTEQGSVTALAVLSTACVAGTESDAAVRIDDPIAPRLLSWRDGKFAGARVRALHPLIRRGAERSSPGAYGFVIARMHYMDEVLRTEVAAGLDELVILGAGYDTRAYRMRDALAGVRVFEIDHPATSRDKRARLAKALGAVPTDVTYVEVDFTHQSLLERLADHGHDPAARTLFLLSGVTPYLPDAAVLEIFDQVASHTSPRTSLLFDYAYEDVLEDPKRYYGGAEWLPFAIDLDEEPRSGFPRGGVGEALSSRGLQLASDLDPDELAARYLRRADGTSVAPPLGFLAVAHGFIAA